MATRWTIDDPVLDEPRRLRMVLVRHGESDWNAERRVQGHLGGGLTERGKVDAARTAEYLRAAVPQPDLLLSSDLERVIGTAQPYAEAVAIPITQDARLREIDNGAWSGLTIDEVLARFGDDVAAIRAGHDLPRGGGERVADLAARTRALVTELAATLPAPSEQQVVVAFAHGGSIRLLTAFALDLPPGGHRLLRGTSNCSISDLTFWIDRAGAVHSGELTTYNSTAHLHGPASGQGAD